MNQVLADTEAFEAVEENVKSRPALSEQAENEMAEQIKQEVPEVVLDATTAKEIVNNYINDVDVKEKALRLAEQIDKRFNGNWFTLKQVMKKTGFRDVKQALGMLQVVILAGYCHVTKNQDNTLKYKVTVDAEHKLVLMLKEKEKLVADKEKTLNQVELHFANQHEALDVEIEKLKVVIQQQKV